ncbi:MAG: hypothetical protein VB099_08270 [Candidatus Limiplasma sp.]|nr:hypothetical protein [Candidatus Limiplasma sp.]
MNWKQKLTSRKLWMALAGFVGMIVVALGGAEETATQITALIMAGASVIAYVIGEGLIDAVGVEQTYWVEPGSEQDKPPDSNG